MKQAPFNSAAKLQQKNESAKKGAGNCKTTRVKFVKSSCGFIKILVWI